jgi:DNA ligase 1
MAKFVDFKPMLAPHEIPEINKIVYPVLASTKLDGIRAVKKTSALLSRNLKPIPNLYVQGLFAALPEGLDGELIFGKPNTDPYRRTVSAVMSEDGTPDVTYYVFDNFLNMNGFADRYNTVKALIAKAKFPNVVLVEQQLCSCAADLEYFEEKCVDQGYEGVMVRSMNGPYKQGRATVKQGYLLKIKRFLDSEAVILGFEERMHNANEAKTNALGHTERSSSKAGKVGRDDLGKFNVRDLKTGVEFDCGVGQGLDDTLRTEIWEHQKKYLGKIIKYKYFPIGSKDKPRFPIFLGFRDKRDM